jgi:hypothetical protein
VQYIVKRGTSLEECPCRKKKIDTKEKYIPSVNYFAGNVDSAIQVVYRADPLESPAEYGSKFA